MGVPPRRGWLAAVVVGLSLCVAGCGLVGGGGDAAPPRDDGSSAAASPSASPTEEAGPIHQIPSSTAACAAARGSGLAVLKTEPRRDDGYESGCDVDVRPKSKSPKASPYRLHITFLEGRTTARAKQDYGLNKDTHFNKSYSPFSGTPSQRSVVLEVGAAKPGEQFDEAHYAFYPNATVAGIHYSQGVLCLLKGNVILTMDVLAGDLTGDTIASIKPVKPEVGQKIFDDVVDEMLALLKP